MGILLLTVPLHAQETDLTRDPYELAQRFLGVTDTHILPDITPVYEVGDDVAFWVSKSNSATPTRITARLGAATSGVYIFVEEGISINQQALSGQAATLQQVFDILRLRDNYGFSTIVPGVGPVANPNNLLILPDVDSDPHLYILYAHDLGSDQYIINPNDSLPSGLTPGSYSNQHEIIIVNTSMLPAGGAGESASTSILARAIYDFISYYNVPQQARWLREALGWSVMLEIQSLDLPQDFIRAYFQSPNVSLHEVTLNGANAGLLGGQQLFLSYLTQRFGNTFIRQLLTRSGAGMSAIDAVLADESFVDPLTANVITAADVFADFVVANVFDAPFGDGRFVHQFRELPQDQGPSGPIIREGLDFTTINQAVSQYGTVYYYVGGQTGAFRLTFNGLPATLRLPFESTRSPEDRFYWSGSAGNRDHRLTRAFDLRSAESATLTFDSWYHLDTGWNYAYLTVSTDNGASWEIIPPEETSSDNRLGLAYGPGLTGISSTGPRPFPYIGVGFASDGMTVTSLVPDGPAAQTDLQVGDQIIGYDETPWPGQPAILQALANYAAGDTFNMYIQRGGQRLSIPVVLGEHPEQVIPPEPEWVSHRADLTPYAGQNILLRFEYISMVNHENPGIAIDNIAIPEINYHDDAEGGSDWTFQGWEWLDNRVRQNFMVQMISSGNETIPPAMRQLIGPADDTTSGEWRFTLQPNQVLVFAISGLKDDTDLPGVFGLSLQDMSSSTS